MASMRNKESQGYRTSYASHLSHLAGRLLSVPGGTLIRKLAISSAIIQGSVITTPAVFELYQ